MFTPRGSASRPRASPFTPKSQTTRTQNRRVSNLFTPKGRTPNASSSKSQGNRSLQASQLIEETGRHRVESYGLPLPVLITEALSLADRHTEITVKIEPSGWAWLVGGRKLFIWRYKQSPNIRGVFCKELTLPPSDLAHNAHRVCVIPSSTDVQSASCVAVSPEGVVRYWPNIAYEGSSSEISAELRGEECACVINFAPYGCLLATTTSSLVLLADVPGMNILVCHPLKASQGMFAGIGRRMSSFIFGASPLQPSGATLQAIVPGPLEEEEERMFYVLSGTQLQKWTITEGNTEKLFYQIDADRLLREALARRIWDKDSIQLTQLKTWLLDMQPTKNGVVLLGVGVNTEWSNNMHFCLAFIDTDIPGTPSGLRDLVLLGYNDMYCEETELRLQNLKLMVPDMNLCYIYDHEIRVLHTSGDSQDVTEFGAPGGGIIGAGCCDGVGLFFSSSVGLFCITPIKSQEASLMEESVHDVSKADVSALTATASQIQELSMSDDKKTCLKAAFLSAMTGNLEKARTSVEELFPEGDKTQMVDQTVVALSQDLIDDFPASDPRWAETRQDPCSSTTSLIILNQLSDKLKAHDYIISFLKKVGLWKRLNTITAHDHTMVTRDVLCEHAEKVAAAMALKQLHNEHHVVIDAAIKMVLEKRDVELSQGLTPQDIFFREVSKVHEIVPALFEFESDVLCADITTAEVLTVVSAVNNVLENMFHKALHYRHTKVPVYHDGFEKLDQSDILSWTSIGGDRGSMLQSRNDFYRALQDRSSNAPVYNDGFQEIDQPEFIPWTSIGGDRGPRVLVLKQYRVTLETALPEVTDQETQTRFCSQLAELADIVLDGYSTQLQSLRLNPEKITSYKELDKKYQQCRQELIRPLLEKEHTELAASLAEKYYDFEILIQLCEQTNNTQRIERYITQFADKGFADVLYAWYMKEGKRGKLLSLPVHKHEELGRFLQTDDSKYLSWIHDIQGSNFCEASESLQELARMEADSLSKKKTLLSLSKLAGLAAEEEIISIAGINEELDLITHQEQLPDNILQQHNLDAEFMKVLSPEELIELYIQDNSSENVELSFKKALDLLQYIDQSDAYYETLRMKIWIKAALRDSWTSDQSSDPQDEIKDTVFFKIAQLAYNDGHDLRIYLPDIDRFLQLDDLGLLYGDMKFHYLLRAGYEHIQELYT